MKIVFDNIIYSLQKSGGGSVYWTELMKRFNKSKDNEITFYEQKEPNSNIFRKTLEVKNINKESFLNLSIRRYLCFTKKITQKAIFHSSYFRISKSKYAINITTIHDFTTEKFRKGIARWINFQQKKYAIKNSNGIICISQNTKKDLLEFFPKTDECKIRVIYNGVSDDFYHIKDFFDISQVDERFKTIKNKQFLLYIGHRTAYKNFFVAVRAAVRVKDDYQLVIIGENLTIDEKIYLDTHLANRYLHLSGISNKELNFLYNQAFALLYPSSYEGFGIPIIEAMRTYCPVIANNTSSIPEVAGDAAILIDQIDEYKIEQALRELKNETFRQSLINKGFEQSKRFSWDITADEYLKFYKELYHEK